MKKVALVFVLAVLVPSLVLAWLAVRSLRDQQFLLERQQSLLYQGVADAVAKRVQDALAEHERAFTQEAARLVSQTNAANVARNFDDLLRQDWPLARVGFVVTLDGDILCPSPYGRPDARNFCADNSRFLANRESAEVYWNPKQSYYLNNGASEFNAPVEQRNGANQSQQVLTPQAQAALPQALLNSSTANNLMQGAGNSRSSLNSDLNPRPGANRAQSQIRNVYPQQKFSGAPKALPQQEIQQQPSKVASAEAEFRQLIGEGNEGTLARFVDNKLNVLFWYRPPGDPQRVFGAQLDLRRLLESLRGCIQQIEPALEEEICVALLDDAAKPVALSHPAFQAPWKHPFVATEVGETLPHWEVAVYLLNPAKLTQSARLLKLTLGLVIAVLVSAIGVGSWLIVADLNRQLTLARQKTDFVSNVSHELKTPLTSIRMFSELLAEGRVADPTKQRSYLGIITAETARLTRLINNVLDFARLERGEKKYNFQACDVIGLVRETAETYRPHLEANGFRFDCTLPESAVCLKCDRDALAQVLVNLLSNAEKYSESRKEIELRATLQPDASGLPNWSADIPVRSNTRTSNETGNRAPVSRIRGLLRTGMSALRSLNGTARRQGTPLDYVEFRVLDRGLGVPNGAEEKIFEQFYRAHDSLSSGIQGSGLGLTLARQIARAHGGEVVYEPREGGGSCFSLRLPLVPPAATPNPEPTAKHYE